MTELLSRKDRERQAKRQDILRAARVVFAEKGLHAATLDEIAEKAEFAKGTLYTYLTNKDDLFISMLEEEIVNFTESLKEVLSRDLPPDETLTQLVKAMMQAFDQNMDLMRLLSQERSALTVCKGSDPMQSQFMPQFKKLNGLVSQLIKKGIEHGIFHRVDPERAASAIFNLCHGAAISAYLNKKKINNAEEVKFITGLVLNGIKAQS
jgi:TetR/AcrR family transcriptional regulator, repressor of fatR-cypB operon